MSLIATIKRDPRFAWFWRILSPLVAGYMYFDSALIRLTCRVSADGPGVGYSGAAVYVNWHKYVSYMCIHHGQHRRCLLMSSAPYLAGVAQWCGWIGLTVVRGAPGERSRDSLALLVELLKRGQSVALAADGPAGPGFQAKPGCVELARAARMPIVPVAFRASRAKSNLKRWDRFYRARMFTTIEVRYGEPIVLDPKETDAAALQRVQSGLDGLE